MGYYSTNVCAECLLKNIHYNADPDPKHWLKAFRREPMFAFFSSVCPFIFCETVVIHFFVFNGIILSPVPVLPRQPNLLASNTEKILWGQCFKYDWLVDMTKFRRCGGLVGCVPASRPPVPGSSFGPGGCPQCGLRVAEDHTVILYK